MTTLLDETAAIAQEEVQHARAAEAFPEVRYGNRGESPVTGGDGDVIYPAPMWAEYKRDFQRASDLEEIADVLIDEMEELEHLADATIAIFWKQAKGGKACKYYAQAQKASGLVGHFTNADFVIVFHAKACVALTAKQIEGLLYHELRHCERHEETNDWIVVDHEYSLFKGEVDRYGLVFGDPLGLAESFKQLALPE